jgi:hypothetical protein
MDCLDFKRHEAFCKRRCDSHCCAKANEAFPVLCLLLSRYDVAMGGRHKEYLCGDDLKLSVLKSHRNDHQSVLIAAMHGVVRKGLQSRLHGLGGSKSCQLILTTGPRHPLLILIRQCRRSVETIRGVPRLQNPPVTTTGEGLDCCNTSHSSTLYLSSRLVDTI